MTALMNVAALQGDAALTVAPRTAAQGKLRLTRRGRVVLGALATVVIAASLGLFASLMAPQASASNTASAQEFPYVLVQSGDSLWSIASDLDPNADPRDVVAEIARLNQLPSPGLQVGDAIAVPLRFAGTELTFPASELAE